MFLHCPKCLIGRSDDIEGGSCQTPNCDGIISKVPEFNTLVDDLPEPITCGRRAQDGMDIENLPFTGAFKSGKNLDRWQKFKSNGDRVCSYCGSLHPDDFMAKVRECAISSEEDLYNSNVEIELSSKRYKFYIHRPKVRNAHEGGIKFYTQHFPLNLDDTSIGLINQAIKMTNIRFTKHLSDIQNGLHATN